MFLSALLFIIGHIFILIAGITGGLLELAAKLLDWILYGALVPFKYTSASEGIIKIAWPLVRDFANIVLVLFLVVIALATILRIAGYQAKKTLPILIGIALLINFTPMICGLIVDASNIVMNYFLKVAGGGNFFSGYLKEAFSGTWNRLNSAAKGEISQNLDLVISGLLLIAFNLIATFILLGYAILFLLRYVAIWLLVILSPIAFVCYILPATRGIFKKWWDQFIQWCFIGVTGAFFLWLACQSLLVMRSAAPPMDAGFTPIDVLKNSIYICVAGIFLIIGFLATLSTSAGGAKGVTGFLKTAPKKIGGAIRRSETAQKIETGVKEGIARTRMGKMLRMKPGTYSAKRREAIRKELTHLSPDELRARLKRGPAIEKSLAFEKLLKEEEISEEDRKYFPEAVASGIIDKGKVLKNYPHWAADFVEQIPGESDEEYKKRQAQAIQETVDKMNPEDFRKNIHPDALKNLDVFYALDLQKTSELGEKGKPNKKKVLRNLIMDKEPEITNEINRLRATGRPEDRTKAEKIENNWIHIANSPNYPEV